MKKETFLKALILVVVTLLVNQNINSQDFQKLDKAPHDISYYRENMITPPLVKVIYGRPQKNDQEVFGNLVEYGKVWRTGANEATEVKFYQDVLFGDKKVTAGTYVLLTVPSENEWEIILSSNIDVLGAFQYNPIYDIAKIKVTSNKAESIEYFSIAFKERNSNIEMVLAWDSTRVNIPLTFKSKEEYAKL